MFCEDRKGKWSDVLESVVSSMNTTVNGATCVSSHYLITARHPNKSLPKLLHNEPTKPCSLWHAN